MKLEKLNSFAQGHNTAGECQQLGLHLQIQALVSAVTYLTAAPIECMFGGTKKLNMQGSVFAHFG